ncbi:hypothetical protein VTK73DRAFT_9295 [Phialemonium thermophilum]|uniref:Heavy metal tolerance protein n=1 Tax=Phialemonium thermophilum TaxID=223376 RepID=A0ABR3XKC6_9PEZI
MEKRLQEKGNWFAYVKGFRVFLPYIWPVNHTGLQIRAVLVGLCLITMNIVNLMIPRQLGIVMDSLSGADHRNPWTQVLIFAALKFTASDAGLSLFRQWLWIPVEYYSFETMSTAAYSHVLNLSSDFHDTKSSSDTMMAIQSGQNVTNVLESVFFRAIPMMVDMVIAFAYLSATFGPFEGLITVATATVFLYTATKMISGLKDARRGEVSAWFEEHYVRQAGIQGWTTVASFNQIGYEERRYASAVKNRVTKSQTVYFKYIVWYAFQYLVLLSGLLAGLFLAVYQVTHGEATAGQFIMLLTYWSQLVAPLSFFATLGKNISRDLIHAEQLLEIMQTKPTVQNKEGAPPLRLVEGGGVLFKNVHFSYDGQKEILKDVDFSVTPGTTVAIVGPTGAGKSTILKLLDRFYDVTEGSILIDGQDVHDVDITSLRAHIGIVPQSPVLFDDTVMNNIRYANLAATDEEVFEACKAASIHDQISGFTDGYNSRVGERGIKLSGGELQRLAIARAILKKPAIVLLDEATSAVDTETEQKIQEALHILCEGRTTFIVAHRLSTIMNADTIIVLSDGKVAEQGPHDVLIRANGKYANLWFKQFLPKGKTGETADNQGIRGRAMMVNGTGPSPSTGTSHISLLQRTFDGDSPCGPDIGEEETKAPSSKPDEATAAGSTTVKHEKEGSRLNPDAPAFTPGLAGSQLETPALKPKPHAPSGDEAFDPDQSLTAEDMRNGDVDQLAAAESYLPSTCPTYTQPLTTVQETCEIGTNFEENSIETAGSSGFESRPLQNLSAKSTKDEFRHPRHSRRLQSRSEPLASNPPPQQ